MKNKALFLFTICILSFIFLVLSKKLGLSWVEISGIFLAVSSLAVSGSLGFKSINDTEKDTIDSIKKELLALIENVRRDMDEADRIHDKNIDFVKQQTALLSQVVQEQNRINAEISSMARDFEQLSAALAQNSKYTEVLKRFQNVERRIEKLENSTR